MQTICYNEEMLDSHVVAQMRVLQATIRERNRYQDPHNFELDKATSPYGYTAPEGKPLVGPINTEPVVLDGSFPVRSIGFNYISDDSDIWMLSAARIVLELPEPDEHGLQLRGINAKAATITRLGRQVLGDTFPKAGYWHLVQTRTVIRRPQTTAYTDARILPQMPTIRGAVRGIRNVADGWR